MVVRARAGRARGVRAAPPALTWLLLLASASAAGGQGQRRQALTNKTGSQVILVKPYQPIKIVGLPPYYVARLTRIEGTTSRPRPATIAAIALSIKSRAIQDSRCYLMNGGAVESFFVSEDMPVGSVIGTLSVNGDPSEEDGNISLKLQEKDAAIGIAPGTKNITLLRQLDREEKNGPSNVYVNVRCDRRRTTDPSFVIPVSVRVWDVNDNAPAWVGAPYSVRLSELTAVGSRILQTARATDADQPGPHATVHYSVLEGPYSDYFSFPNELDSILVLQKPLDYESLSNFSVTLRAQDQGRPPRHNDTTLSVEVMDADDQNPRFSADHYTAVLPEDAKEGTQLAIGPGPIAAMDQDLGINAPLYYSSKGDMIAIDKDSGRVACTAKLLQEGRPVTVVIKATQYDNADRYALATLTINPARAARGGGGAGAVRFTQRSYTAAVPEDTPVGSVLMTLHTNRDRDQSPLQFYVSDRTFLEKFAINSAGELLLRRALDYETEELYHYQVMVTDGAANDTASINITVLNVNDWEPRFKHAQYEFQVDADVAGEAGGGAGAGAGLLPVGRVLVHDGDRGDYVALSLRGPDASLFYINDLGEMFMKQEALSTLNTSVVHVVATAVDSGTPPRQSSVPVLVHVPPGLLAARAGGGGGAVLAVFACALALLAALVLALLGYIYRNKRLKSSAGTAKPSTGFVQREKVPEGAGGGAPAGRGGSGVAGGPGTLGVAPSGSLLSVSAGASTILANSSSSLDLRSGTLPNNGSAGANGRQSQRFPTKTKIAPAPPTPGSPGSRGLPAGAGAGAGGGPARMSDHIHAGAGRSGVAWPSATIPARVKKLSWDDADRDTKLQMNGELKPSSEVHDATNPAVAEHMNLTVYF